MLTGNPTFTSRCSTMDSCLMQEHLAKYRKVSSHKSKCQKVREESLKPGSHFRVTGAHAQLRCPIWLSSLQTCMKMISLGGEM